MQELLGTFIFLRQANWKFFTIRVYSICLEIPDWPSQNTSFTVISYFTPYQIVPCLQNWQLYLVICPRPELVAAYNATSFQSRVLIWWLQLPLGFFRSYSAQSKMDKSLLWNVSVFQDQKEKFPWKQDFI